MDTAVMSDRITKDTENFPVNDKLGIPMIIHQSWRNEDINTKHAKWTKSWINNHPRWTYMFWTDISAKQMIADKYPRLLSIFDSYPVASRHVDVLRYIVLYEYGGVFVDLDMESLKPLDELTKKYTCFLPQSTFRQTPLKQVKLNIDAIFACRAKHPLLKSILYKLRLFRPTLNNSDNGPESTVLQFKNYLHRNRLDETHIDGLYLAPAEYFDVESDLKATDKQCDNFQSLTNLQKRACLSFVRKALKRKPFADTFTISHRSEKKIFLTR